MSFCVVFTRTRVDVAVPMAVTAYGRSADRRKALESGFLAQIPKLIDPELFVGLIVSAMQQGT
jgi:hypothetical protein